MWLAVATTDVITSRESGKEFGPKVMPVVSPQRAYSSRFVFLAIAVMKSHRRISRDGNGKFCARTSATARISSLTNNGVIEFDPESTLSVM
ncbi:unnamed protein product [Fusarium graminearum]|uniref:Uncharacterized protein n=1 Tax=Gibberella zeae TaxID=5518 RepID=A0A4U9F542_GIBZA|nr:unnamed protein product [Fusarium graminearum]VTO90298.1 unnamed protein product [Fusarium graminearum]